METIILRQPGQLVRTQTEPPPAPKAGQALVRVGRVGICGTDMHAYRGQQPFFSYPRILGHELGVEVEAVGPGVEGINPGDQCAVEPYLNCGQCSACRRGRANCCTNLEVLGVHRDGGMRQQILVPAAKLHPSGTLALEQLALVEPLGIGAHAVDRSGLTPGEAVLVIGAGPIGLAVIQFAQIAGTEPIVIEINPDRARFCREQFNVEHCIETTNPVEHLQDLLDGDLPTVVFDATGNPKSMEAAFGYIANGGRLVFVGFVQGQIAFTSAEFHRREVTLLASRNAQTKDFAKIVALMEEGKVNTQPWITHRAEYGDLIEQFDPWLQPETGVVKAMFSW